MLLQEVATASMAPVPTVFHSETYNMLAVKFFQAPVHAHWPIYTDPRSHALEER
jgi:hypothetical protein